MPEPRVVAIAEAEELGTQQSIKAMDGEYNFDQTGEGVFVFVVDTGISQDHIDFFDDEDLTRIHCSWNAYHPNRDASKNKSCEDKVGHGTHTAGVIGGTTFGVAKNARMISIKTFTDDGIGSIGSVISGLDYIQRTKDLNPDMSMIVNMSFGTHAMSDAFESAIAGVVNAAVVVIASAGNEGGNACEKAPAMYENVITVGSSTINDEVAPHSNQGECLNVFAPGDRITSAWINGPFDQAAISGTSAAAAHATGVVALILERFPRMMPDEVMEGLMFHSEIAALLGVSEDSPNALLNMAQLASAWV